MIERLGEEVGEIVSRSYEGNLIGFDDFRRIREQRNGDEAAAIPGLSGQIVFGCTLSPGVA